MFDELMSTVDKFGEHLKKKKSAGVSNTAIYNYRFGYDSGFFDVVVVLRGQGLLTKEEMEILSKHFDKTVEDVNG